MDNRIYGYARVSTREQNEDRQIEALTKFGVPEQNIIIDKASGKDAVREGYQYLKRQILRKGDTLVIKELDRLSRNKSDIKKELEELKAVGIRVKILDIPTTLTDFPPEQEWVMDMINAILIEVLGAIAENERKKIRARQREGIAAAKKKNVRFGRPPKSLPEGWQKIMSDVRCGNKKYHVGLIAFHSKKKDCVIQEIFASLIMYNFSMLITENILIDDDKHNDYRYKINYATAIHICIAFFRCSNVSPSNLEKLIARNKRPVRPDRNAVRKTRYHSAIGFNYRLS